MKAARKKPLWSRQTYFVVILVCCVLLFFASRSLRHGPADTTFTTTSTFTSELQQIDEREEVADGVMLNLSDPDIEDVDGIQSVKAYQVRWENDFRNRRQLIKEEYARVKAAYAGRSPPNSFESQRPETRTFVSKAVDEVVRNYTSRMQDRELAWLFENCFPNTLDTTVKFSRHVENGASSKLDTFIITGDINAMWLRDSTNQVWPYLSLTKEDPDLRDMIRGLINRQVRLVLLDPYANAFVDARIDSWSKDITKIEPGVYERKYELDSIASVLRLSVGYYEVTGDRSAFDDTWFLAMDKLISHIKTNQRTHGEYHFQRTTTEATETLQHGYGRPGKLCGMSQSPFRPSDDASTFLYPVAANGMTATNLKRMVKQGLLDAKPELKERATKLYKEIERGIRQWGIINHPVYGRIFAYEADGRGSVELMDDANVPSLLSLPYLGVVPQDSEVYQRTRQFVLSPDNPWFIKGPSGYGIGSPHVNGPDVRLNYIWPISIITRALTSSQDEEILLCLEMLKATHANTGFMHESFHKESADRYTRDWFAWANTLFGELILKIGQERPHLIFKP